MPERELTFAQAVREALAEEMRRDQRVCIFGEDVAEAGTPFKVLSGLVEEFGAVQLNLQELLELEAKSRCSMYCRVMPEMSVVWM